MLEAHILKHLIQEEGRSGIVKGKVTGWSLAHFQQRYGIPKTNFLPFGKYIDQESYDRTAKTWFLCIVSNDEGAL